MLYHIEFSAESLPLALFGISALAGIALIFNAMVVALRSGHKYSLIAWGIVAVVALDLVAILSIGAHFAVLFRLTEFLFETSLPSLKRADTNLG